MAFLSGLFVACRVGYQELDPNGSTPATAGRAGTTSSTNEGGTAGGARTPAAGGGDASQGDAAGADGGQPGADGGVAGATSGGAAVAGAGSSAGASAGGTGSAGGSVSSAGSSAGGSGNCGALPCPASCEGHEYGGHLYAFCSTPLMRSEAEAACEGMGFELVRVDDADELAWLRGICFASVGSNNSSTVWPWLGANDLAVAGEWRWVDGTQFWQGTQTGGPVGGLYENWGQGQPTAKDACATMQNNAADSLWSVQPCTSAHPYTCESN